MRDFKRSKGRITEDGYSLHCNVSLVVASYAVGGLVAAAGTFTAIGAGVAAVGSITDSRALKNIGGAMMVGGGIVSGGGALMAGGLSTLGTLSAGASLVGGALQGVGMLTGNSKMAGIGALINGAGMAGSAYDASSLAGSQASTGTNIVDKTPDIAGEAISTAPANASKITDVLAKQSSGVLGNDAAAKTGMDAVFSKIEKYDKLINMAGKAVDTMNNNRQENDMLAQNQSQFEQNLALNQKRSTAVAIPGQVGISAQANPAAVQPIDPNYYRRTPPAGLIGAHV